LNFYIVIIYFFEFNHEHNLKIPKAVFSHELEISYRYAVSNHYIKRTRFKLLTTNFQFLDYVILFVGPCFGS